MGGVEVHRGREAVTVAAYWIITIAAVIALILSYLNQFITESPANPGPPPSPGRFVHLPRL